MADLSFLNRPGYESVLNDDGTFTQRAYKEKSSALSYSDWFKQTKPDTQGMGGSMDMIQADYNKYLEEYNGKPNREYTGDEITRYADPLKDYETYKDTDGIYTEEQRAGLETIYDEALKKRDMEQNKQRQDIATLEQAINESYSSELTPRDLIDNEELASTLLGEEDTALGFK